MYVETSINISHVGSVGIKLHPVPNIYIERYGYIDI